MMVDGRREQQEEADGFDKINRGLETKIRDNARMLRGENDLFS